MRLYVLNIEGKAEKSHTLPLHDVAHFGRHLHHRLSEE